MSEQGEIANGQGTNIVNNVNNVNNANNVNHANADPEHVTRRTEAQQENC